MSHPASHYIRELKKKASTTHVKWIVVFVVMVFLWSVRFIGKPPEYMLDSLRAFQLFPSEYDYMLWSQKPEHAPPGTWTPTYLPGTLQRPYSLSVEKLRTTGITSEGNTWVSGLKGRYEAQKQAVHGGFKDVLAGPIKTPVAGSQQIYTCKNHYPRGYMGVVYGPLNEQLYSLDEWWQEYEQMYTWFITIPAAMKPMDTQNPRMQLRWTKLADGSGAIYVSNEQRNKSIRHRRSPDESEDALVYESWASLLFVRGNTMIGIGLESMCLPEGITSLEPEMIKVADSLVESK